MAGWIRYAIGATLALILCSPSAGRAFAAGDADCNWVGVCELSDNAPGKPAAGSGKGKSDTPDKPPEYPNCAAFPEAYDSAPDDPEGWVEVSCMEAGIPITVWVEGGATPEQIARSLIARIQLKPIEIGLTPRGVDAMTVVGMPVWLWVDDPSRTTWGPATITAGGMSLTAEVRSVTWEMGDGTTLKCGKGTEWRRGMGAKPSPTCGHTYEKQGRYTIRARSHWVASWTGYGQSGTIPVTMSASRRLDVGEIQVIQTGG